MVTLNTLRTGEGEQVYFENIFKFALAVDLDKYFKQVKLLINDLK